MRVLVEALGSFPGHLSLETSPPRLGQSRKAPAFLNSLIAYGFSLELQRGPPFQALGTYKLGRQHLLLAQPHRLPHRERPPSGLSQAQLLVQEGAPPLQLHGTLQVYAILSMPTKSFNTLEKCKHLKLPP